MINSYPPHAKLIFTTLLFIAVLLTWVIRLSALGWILVIFGIPMLFMTLLHLAIHLYAIYKIPRGNPWFMVASNLLFLLWLALQGEGGDSGSGIVIYYFLKTLKLSVAWLDNPQFGDYDPFLLILLIVSLGILLGQALIRPRDLPNPNP